MRGTVSTVTSHRPKGVSDDHTRSDSRIAELAQCR